VHSALCAMITRHKPDNVVTKRRFQAKISRKWGPYRIKSQHCVTHTELTEPGTLNAEGRPKSAPKCPAEHRHSLAPAKSNRDRVLVTDHARCRHRLLRLFRCGLDLIRRRRGNGIGEDGLRHRKHSGKKNCRKGGAEHGEFLITGRSMEAN
jgi:hypothetical protein